VASPGVARPAIRLDGVPDEDVFALTAVERRRAADMFARLSGEQWAVRSLCAEWTVRDVAGHLIGPFCVSVSRFVLGSLVSGGPSRYSVEQSRRLGRRPAGEIVAILREHADQRFVPPGTGPLAPLTDLAVHTRDVARPLGLDTTASPAAWRGALGFLTSPRARRGFVPRGRTDGLRFRATDQGWAHGQGAEITGPAEALALAIGGRPVARDDLAGPGLPVLRDRLS
jgi:uncharacterized protein (TIGR03083 family)